MTGIVLIYTGTGPWIPVPDVNWPQTVSVTPAPSVSGMEQAVVGRVIDGDTVELRDGRKVRYIGIDTPEITAGSGGIPCYGKEAADRNRELVEGETVSLQKDISETDRYGRILRYVFKDGDMVNEILVREGYARAATYPPDVSFSTLFLDAEQSARAGDRGLWLGCNSK